jgi:hypothetical protein
MTDPRIKQAAQEIIEHLNSGRHGSPFGYAWQRSTEEILSRIFARPEAPHPTIEDLAALETCISQLRSQLDAANAALVQHVVPIAEFTTYTYHKPGCPVFTVNDAVCFSCGAKSNRAAVPRPEGEARECVICHRVHDVANNCEEVAAVENPLVCNDCGHEGCDCGPAVESPAGPPPKPIGGTVATPHEIAERTIQSLWNTNELLARARQGAPTRHKWVLAQPCAEGRHASCDFEECGCVCHMARQAAKEGK